MPLLFSYGTLQLEQVQIETYGRKLEGDKDVLQCYRIEQLEITDPFVLKTSGERFHPIAKKSGDPTDELEGMVFKITDEELAETDKYEVSDYERVEETFKSGVQAWIYTAKRS